MSSPYLPGYIPILPPNGPSQRELDMIDNPALEPLTPNPPFPSSSTETAPIPDSSLDLPSDPSLLPIPETAPIPDPPVDLPSEPTSTAVPETPPESSVDEPGPAAAGADGGEAGPE